MMLLLSFPPEGRPGERTASHGVARRLIIQVQVFVFPGLFIAST